jgi:ribosomal protein S12 methylthiotransferase accessory factor YcaO
MILSSTPESLAWEILEQGEFDRQAISMAHDRAACAGRHPPASIGDYLYWLETEADIQETQAEAFPNEAPRRQAFAAALREIANRLRDLGFEPLNPADLNESPDVPVMQTAVYALEKNITLPDQFPISNP